jgi:uncharacterized protein YggE
VLGSPVLAQETRNTVVVTGEAKISVAPELAYVSLGVVSDSPTAYGALTRNNETMKSLFAVLTENGVEKKDVQTSGFNISPRHEYIQKTQEHKFIGYQVSNSVTITVRDLANLGKLLDVLVKSGSNNVQGITWGVCEPGKLADDCRKKAMQDAKRKAALYAEGGEFKLGGVVGVVENGTSSPRPQLYASMRDNAPGAAGGEVSVAPGEVGLIVRVTVTYAIEK